MGRDDDGAGPSDVHPDSLDTGTERALSQAGRGDPDAIADGLAELRGRLFGARRPAPQLGRYLLEQRIGHGGMGVVFRGRDPELQRSVAVKLLHVGEQADASSDSLIAEARALAQIDHPNIVPVHDVGRYEPSDLREHRPGVLAIPPEGVFIVMQWLEGLRLDHWLAQRTRTRAEIMRVLDGVARGLEHVHAAGLVHRDLKPANVIVDAHDEPRILDFGLAGGVEQSSSHAGTVMGTPRYMAPEQHRGRGADPRTDQYALAVTWFEALAGTPPFEHDELRDLVRAKVEGALDRRASRAVGSAYLPILRRALDPDPLRRHAGVAEFRLAMAGVERRRRRIGAAAVVSVVGAVAVGVGMESRADPCISPDEARHELWSEARAAQVRAVLDERPSVAPREPAIGARFEMFVDAWADERSAACTAIIDAPSAASEARVLCLERMHASFEATVDLLLDPEAGVAGEAGVLAEALPDPRRCQDRRNADLELLLPTTSGARVAAQGVVRSLERARSQGVAGRFDEQLVAAREAHQGALSLEHPPLLVATEAHLARALWDAERTEEGLAVAQRALHAAERLGDVERSVDIQVEMVGMLGGSLGRFDEALGLATALDARCEALADPDRMRAAVRHNVGRTLLSRGDPRAALDELEQALKLRVRNGDVGPGLPSTLNLMGTAWLRLGEPEQAQEMFERALKARVRIQGLQHPGTAMQRNNVGNAQLAQGRIDEAYETFKEALEVFEATTGPRTADIAMVLNNVGVVEQARGDWRAAERTHRRALATKIELLGPEHADVGYSHVNLGDVLRRLGQLDRAEASFTQALENWSGAWGDDHPLLAEPLLGLAEVAVARDDLEATARWLTRAETQLGQGSVGDGGRRARIDGLRARVVLPIDRARAIRLARRALANLASDPEQSRFRRELRAWMAAEDLPVPGGLQVEP